MESARVSKGSTPFKKNKMQLEPLGAHLQGKGVANEAASDAPRKWSRQNLAQGLTTA